MMPVILKPQVYGKWLDKKNHNTVELAVLLQNEIILQFVSHPLPQRTGATGHTDPSRTAAAGKARQTTFVWPERS